MAVPEIEYVMTTSASDPLCDTGFGGYVDLELYGILAQPGITGDTVAFEAFLSGDPINYYGAEYVGMGFVDDGFAIFDPASNYGGMPWFPQVIPDAELPNNLLAVFWQDFEIFYDAATNAGVSLATAGPDIMLVEYDDIQLYGGSPAIMDFEIVASRSVNNTPGYYEFVYAYDNINYALPATIGLEDAAGANAVALVNNGDTAGVISNGFMVCFDQVGAADPAVITYQATVDMDNLYLNLTLTNHVVHDTDNPGSMEATTSTDVAVAAIIPAELKQESRDNLHNLLPTGDSTTDKRIETAIARIDKSLDPDRWETDSTLTDKGNKVFDEEKMAANMLVLVIKDGGPAAGAVQVAAEMLVVADQALAEAAIDAAIAGGGDANRIERAEYELAQAADALGRGHYERAIDHCKRAWDNAVKALR
jgi:hypothetical protein